MNGHTRDENDAEAEYLRAFRGGQGRTAEEVVGIGELASWVAIASLAGMAVWAALSLLGLGS